jgi:glycosyltransferase involved in cell wall biosynthesis
MSSGLTIVLLCHWAFCAANFRGGLVRELTQKGHRVVVIAPPEPEYEEVLRDLGAEFYAWRLHSKGKNPFSEAAAVLHLVNLLRQIRPHVVFTYTIKPVIYGAIAGRLGGVPVISVITGLGYVFLNDNWISKLARRLYGWTLDWSKEVWFLNSVDEQTFRQARILKKAPVCFLPGEGINTGHFAPMERLSLGKPNVTAATAAPKSPIFLMIARFLRDKGALEFVAAARIVKAQFPLARFQMLGGFDLNNPGSIAPKQMVDWEREGVIENLGTLQDVRPAIQAADCVVLPSYREGLPRAMLEASAMCKPVIATDVPGCRDVVASGVTGFLCAPQSEADLAAKMLAFLRLPQHDRAQMGRNGRAFVRRQFDEQIVFVHYLQALDRLELQSTRQTLQDAELIRLAARDGVPASGSRQAHSPPARPGAKENAPASVL